jgi:tetratricopeptide (TPR) repeat protein
MPGLVVVAVVLIYARCAGFQLLGWDDIDYVTENHALRLPLGEFLTRITTGFVPRAHGDYLPITLLSYWLEFRAVGLQPWLYHLNNVVLFAAGCVVLYRVLIPITGQAWTALLVAVAFAAHPLNVEAVAWVSERKSVLSLLLCLLAFAAVLPPKPGGRVSRLRLAGSILLYALACLSKSAVVFFPIVLWGHYWITARESATRSATRALPYVVPAGLTAWARMHGHLISGQANFAPFDSATSQALTMASLLGKYVVKILAPVRLNHCYELSVTTTFADMFVWIGAATLLIAVAGIVRFRHRLPAASFGLIWFLAGWLPHMQLRPIPPALRADRYMFFALPGFLLCGLVLAAHVFRPIRQAYRVRLAAILAAVSVTTLGLLSWSRTAVWANDFTLWEDSLQKNPDSVIANSHYGVNLLEAGRLDEAEAHFRRALAGSDERDFMALNGLAAVLGRRGRHAEAINMLHRSLSVPNVPPEKQAQTFAAIGQYELARRRPDKAREAYVQAVHLNPFLPEALGGLASTLTLIGRIDKALAYHRRAIELRPDDPTLLFNYSLTLTSAGKTDEAVAALRRCLKLNPTYASAYGQMGVIHARSKNWAEAVRFFSEAARLEPGNREIATYLQQARSKLLESSPK